MTEWLLVLLAVALTAGTSLFVAAEFSLVALDRPTVQQAVDEGDGRARSVLGSLRELSTQLSAAQVGITLTTLVVGYVAEPSVGQLLTLAGWGSLTSVNPAPSTKLQQGTVKVGQVATATLGVQGVAPTSTTSACVYDSGAPYFVAAGSGGQLVSVESTGPDCPHNHLETTSRVDFVEDGIASHTG